MDKHDGRRTMVDIAIGVFIGLVLYTVFLGLVFYVNRFL